MALAFGDVSVDGRAGDHLAGRVLERGHGHRDLDVTAALSNPIELRVEDALASRHPFQKGAHVVGAVRGDEVEQRHAKRFLVRVAIELLRA